MSTFDELDALAALVDVDPEDAYRLFRVGRSAEYELGGTAVAAFADLLRNEPAARRVFQRINLAHELMVSGRRQDYALLCLLDAADDWATVRATLRSGGGSGTRRQAADVIAAMDQHVAARLQYGLDVSANIGLGRVSRPVAGAGVLTVSGVGAELVKDLAVATAKANKETRELMALLQRYLGTDDPAWDSIAALIADRVKAGGRGARQANLAIAVEGKLGEHLAMRTPEAWAFIRRVYRETPARVRKLIDEGWVLRLEARPTFAATRGGGLGEIYDGSVWLVRTTDAGVLEAMPVLMLQVKAGQVRTAVKQIRSDVRREHAEFIELFERTFGTMVPRRFVPPDGYVPDRVLVAPRPPSATRVREDMPAGVVVDYARLPLTKRQMVTASGLVTTVGARQARRNLAKAKP